MINSFHWIYLVNVVWCSACLDRKNWHWRHRWIRILAYMRTRYRKTSRAGGISATKEQGGNKKYVRNRSHELDRMWVYYLETFDRWFIWWIRLSIWVQISVVNVTNLSGALDLPQEMFLISFHINFQCTSRYPLPRRMRATTYTFLLYLFLHTNYFTKSIAQSNSFLRLIVKFDHLIPKSNFNFPIVRKIRLIYSKYLSHFRMTCIDPFLLFHHFYYWSQKLILIFKW